MEEILMNNPFKRLPKQTPQNTFTLDKICEKCEAVIEQYASFCTTCGKELCDG